MKKKLVTMLLASCILTSSFSLTVYADAIEFETEIIYDDIDIPVVSGYSQTHSIKEEKLQKAVADLSQFKSDLKEYKKNIKYIKTELRKSKRDYGKLKKYYKSAKKSFKNADESLTSVLDDLSTMSNVLDLIIEYQDPDMGYTQTDADLQQASLDYTEVKKYLTDTRDYLKQFKRYNIVTSDAFKGDLTKAKAYVDFAIKTKDSKKIKTNKKLGDICSGYSDGYKKYVNYGFYSDDTISSQIKAYNKYRKSKKLPAMKNNSKLNKAAAMLALEYAVGYNLDKDGNNVYGSETHKRPDGSDYTTAIKECGIKKFKSSSAVCITETGEENFNFVKTALSFDMYDKVLKGKKYTEYGIGYYSTSNGGLQVWVLIPISK